MAAALLASALAGVAGAAPLVDLSRERLDAYAGPQFRVTQFYGKWGLAGGGPLAMVVLERRYGLGLVWSSAEGDIDGRWPAWLGMRGESVVARVEMLSISFGQLVGAGALVPTQPGARGGAFLVFEPDLSLAVRILPSTRLAFGAGYRWVPWAEEGADEAGLSAPFFGLSLQYGFFGTQAQRGAAPRVQLSGYYGAKFTTLAGETTWLDGGGTRILFGSSLAVGATGYLTRRDVALRGKSVSGGYGGLEGSWSFFPRGPLHLVAGAVVAVGSAGWVDAGTEQATTALLLEPEALLELDVATFFRLAVGASYRRAFPFGAEAALSARELSGPAALVQLRYGWFQ